jgi:hypothetical protein
MVTLFQNNINRFDCHGLLFERDTCVLFFGGGHVLEADKPQIAAYFPTHTHIGTMPTIAA